MKQAIKSLRKGVQCTSNLAECIRKHKLSLRKKVCNLLPMPVMLVTCCFLSVSVWRTSILRLQTRAVSPKISINASNLSEKSEPISQKMVYSAPGNAQSAPFLLLAGRVQHSDVQKFTKIHGKTVKSPFPRRRGGSEVTVRTVAASSFHSAGQTSSER